MIPELINHLWQSTFFVFAASVVAIALRRNRAKVRYWLWLGASIKFLVPFALLAGVGQWMEQAPAAQELATPIASTTFSYTVSQITEPFSTVLPATIPPAAPPSLLDQLPPAFFLVWLSGVLTLVAVRCRGWRRVRAAIRSGAPLDLGVSVEVRASDALIEPGVVGALRPILLLPVGILSRLTPSQLQAVLAHELCHVRRRDNLTAAFHMGVETIFWFHPLVWWIGARLVAERERACDEEVLRLGNEPVVYAEGILNVCKFYQESPLACVPGVTGADLKQRVEEILRNRAALGLSFGRAVLLAGFAFAALAAPVAMGVVHAAAKRIHRQPPVAAILGAVAVAPSRQPLPEPASQPTVQPPAPTAQATADRFEVVSIRPADPAAAGGRGGARGGGQRGAGPLGGAACRGFVQINPGRISMTNVTGLRLLLLAYTKNCRASVEMELITGIPDWMKTDAFDIQATMPAGTPSYTVQQLDFGEAPIVQRMIQNLLADRFGLALHRTSKEVAQYNLVMVRPGKFTRSPDQTPPPPIPLPGPLNPAAPPSGPFVMPRGGFSLGVNPPEGIVTIELNAAPLAVLINVFQAQEGRFVIDKTGLTGLLDLPRQELNVGPFDISENAVSVWPEIMQQLGLRLEPARGPVEVLAIDRVEQLREN